MEPKHLVAKGLPTVNTHELLQQIDDVLKDYLAPIYYQRQPNPISKQRRKQKNKQLSQFFDLKRPGLSFDEPLRRKKEETEEAFQKRLHKFYQELSVKQAELRKAICSSIGEHLTIWLWYIKDENLVERLKAIQYCLGLPDAAKGSYPFPEGLTINIRTQEAGSIAERLDLPTRHKPRRTQRETSVNNRKMQIADIVQPIQPELLGKVGVWFELYGKECWKKYPWCDPKSAIRLGFADVGIGSQFTTPERKSYQQKAISSFIDLLRFLGVRLAPSRINLRNVAENTPINEVGLWLVNRTSRTSAHGRPHLIPVMVKISSLTAEISAIYPGLESWIPYDEASLRIN